jgi:tryptophan 5-monooxygenase
MGVNVVHIESRPSGRKEAEYEVLVELECDNRMMDQVVRQLRREVSAINLATFQEGSIDIPPPTPSSTTTSFGMYPSRAFLVSGRGKWSLGGVGHK